MRHRLTWHAFIFLVLCVAPTLARAQDERPVAGVLASADSAWDGHRYAAARAAYASVVRRDSSSARAVFRLATLLAWDNELDGALVLFRSYVQLAPADVDGAVALARTLAWRGRYEESLALYDSLLARDPAEREAALGAAQVIAWSGQLDSAISRYRAWLANHEADAEAWAALARIYRWAGRPRDARQALHRALAARPDDREAAAQLALVDADLSAALAPTVTWTNDSDHSLSTIYALQTSVGAPWNARATADASVRDAQLGPVAGTSLTLRAATSWPVAGGSWSVSGAAGASRLEASAAPGAGTVLHTEPVLALRAAGRVGSLLRLGAGASHAAFDETAPLILSGLSITGVDGDAELALHPRLSLSGGGGILRVVGGSVPNARSAISGALRLSPRPELSVAAAVRTFGYDHAASDGYFSPRRYLLAEASGRLHLGHAIGWGLDTDAGLGRQVVTAFDGSSAARFAQRFSAALAYRFTPGSEIGLGAGFANAASPTTVSSTDYRAWSMSLRARAGL